MSRESAGTSAWTIALGIILACVIIPLGSCLACAVGCGTCGTIGIIGSAGNTHHNLGLEDASHQKDLEEAMSLENRDSRSLR